MQTKIILYNGSSIYYTVTGNGPRVVLIHGFGETGAIWKNQIYLLSASFQLIIPDLPGSGQSEFINNANIETYALVIKVILDAEINSASELKQNSAVTQKNKVFFTMIGHSMGGYIALAFAEKFSGYLNALGLFHSSAFADSEEKKIRRKKAIDFIALKGAFNFLKSSIPGLFTKTYMDDNTQEIENLIKKGEKFTNGALIQYYTAMCERPDRTKVIENFDGHFLFLIGQWDKAIPLQISLQQSHLPVQSYVDILALSAHMGLWEEIDKTNKILFQFLCSI